MLRYLKAPFPSDEKHTLSQEDPSFFVMVLTSKRVKVLFSRASVSGPWLHHEQGSTSLPSQKDLQGSGGVDMALVSSVELQGLYS